MQHVFAYIDTLDIDEASLDVRALTPPADYTHRYNFILVSPFPRTEYTLDEPEAIISSISGWWPSASLLVETTKEEDEDEEAEA